MGDPIKPPTSQPVNLPTPPSDTEEPTSSPVEITFGPPASSKPAVSTTNPSVEQDDLPKKWKRYVSKGLVPTTTAASFVGARLLSSAGIALGSDVEVKGIQTDNIIFTAGTAIFSARNLSYSGLLSWLGESDEKEANVWRISNFTVGGVALAGGLVTKNEGDILFGTSVLMDGGLELGAKKLGKKKAGLLQGGAGIGLTGLGFAIDAIQKNKEQKAIDDGGGFATPGAENPSLVVKFPGLGDGAKQLGVANIIIGGSTYLFAKEKDLPVSATVQTSQGGAILMISGQLPEVGSLFLRK